MILVPSLPDIPKTVPSGVWKITPRMEGFVIEAIRRDGSLWTLGCHGWAFDRADPYREILEREGIDWQSFRVVAYSAEPGVNRHRLVCGSVRPKEGLAA
jgi:hypothetical protein